jgi:transcriptional regulator with XRE-family HTH domain
MKLKQWLIANRKGRNRDFASELGLSPSYLSQLLSGHRSPRNDLMRRIHAATGGAVTPNDWVLGTADSDHTNGNEDRGALCP